MRREVRDNQLTPKSEPETTGQKMKRFVLANLLVILTVSAVIVGVFIGLGVRSAGLSRTQILYFGFPGELLIRLLKMIIIPLVVCTGRLGDALLSGDHSDRVCHRRYY
uniref:Amino acid transporter n=1 Tax=Sinocyclocheilus rhinocerous TaxID=307959 RepID=A0A673GFA6_9TELE